LIYTQSIHKLISNCTQWLNIVLNHLEFNSHDIIWTMAWYSLGTFHVPNSDSETTKSEPNYKSAEDRPSTVKEHNANSEKEPEQVGQPLGEQTKQEESPLEPNELKPDTNKDLSALFSVKGWNPLEPHPEPFNPFYFLQSPTLPPLPPTPEPKMAADVAMNDVDSKIKEVKLNPPKPFDRKRENLWTFIQDGELYLLINKEIYKDDLEKIEFFLSFMNEGDAASWKEQLMEDTMATAQGNNTDLNLGYFA
jgi:hypothetical protein